MSRSKANDAKDLLFSSVLAQDQVVCMESTLDRGDPEIFKLCTEVYINGQ